MIELVMGPVLFEMTSVFDGCDVDESVGLR
jgi:hypothetical protein